MLEQEKQKVIAEYEQRKKEREKKRAEKKNKDKKGEEDDKKKDKKAEIKFIKDETVKKDDFYKSHTVHVPSGEPASSQSRPPAKRKPGIVRPITQGKLLKAGGPSNVRVSFPGSAGANIGYRNRNPPHDQSRRHNLFLARPRRLRSLRP